MTLRTSAAVGPTRAIRRMPMLDQRADSLGPGSGLAEAAARQQQPDDPVFVSGWQLFVAGDSRPLPADALQQPGMIFLQPLKDAQQIVVAQR